MFKYFVLIFTLLIIFTYLVIIYGFNLALEHQNIDQVHAYITYTIGTSIFCAVFVFLMILVIPNDELIKSKKGFKNA